MFDFELSVRVGSLNTTEYYPETGLVDHLDIIKFWNNISRRISKKKINHKNLYYFFVSLANDLPLHVVCYRVRVSEPGYHNVTVSFIVLN